MFTKYFIFFMIASFNMMSLAFNSKISNRMIRSNIRSPTTILQMSTNERIYGGPYNIYKTRAAVSIKPILPRFKTYQSSNNMNLSKILAKEGTLLFEFAASTGTSTREYDWNKKIVFSLNLNECGEVLRFKEGPQGVLMEFSHDPSLGTNEAGGIMKKMKWTTTPDGKGMFLSISIYDKSNASGSANLSIPISWGEFEIIKTIIQYCIPRFLGLDKQFESAVNTVTDTVQSNPQSSNQPPPYYNNKY